VVSFGMVHALYTINHGYFMGQCAPMLRYKEAKSIVTTTIAPIVIALSCSSHQDNKTAVHNCRRSSQMSWMQFFRFGYLTIPRSYT
jgi:hypothetical protein